MLRKLKVSRDIYHAIDRAAEKGGYVSTAVSLLTPNLNPAKRASDAAYLVIDNAHMLTIIQLDTHGRPVAELEEA